MFAVHVSPINQRNEVKKVKIRLKLENKKSSYDLREILFGALNLLNNRDIAAN